MCAHIYIKMYMCLLIIITKGLLPVTAVVAAGMSFRCVSLCVYVLCVCVYTYIYIYICVCVCLLFTLKPHIDDYRGRSWNLIHLYVCVCELCVYACIYAHTHLCVYEYTHTCIHIHTCKRKVPLRGGGLDSQYSGTPYACIHANTHPHAYNIYIYAYIHTHRRFRHEEEALIRSIVAASKK